MNPNRTPVLGASSKPNYSSSTGSSQLSIITYNARSVLPKISELQATCLAVNPDTVCVTESWLSAEIEDLEVTIPDLLYSSGHKSTWWWTCNILQEYNGVQASVTN